jgi:predicted nucleic acid-binding protein
MRLAARNAIAADDGIDHAVDGAVPQDVQRGGATYADRILPINTAIATTWGRMAALVERRGGSLGVVDGLISATAVHHGYTVVTRHTDDFAATGVALLNVWQD